MLFIVHYWVFFNILRDRDHIDKKTDGFHCRGGQRID